MPVKTKCRRPAVLRTVAISANQTVVTTYRRAGHGPGTRSEFVRPAMIFGQDIATKCSIQGSLDPGNDIGYVISPGYGG